MTYPFYVLTDREASELELLDALSFWSRWHNIGSRARVRAAIHYYRKYH